MGGKVKVGDICLNKGKGVLVEIMALEYNTMIREMEWHVEEIETGQCYPLRYHSLGDALSEMEVLGWCAK
jgi:hypothetical protein